MIGSILLSQQLSKCSRQTHRRLNNERIKIMLPQDHATKRTTFIKRCYSSQRVHLKKQDSSQRCHAAYTTKLADKKVAVALSVESSKSSFSSRLFHQPTRHLICGGLTVSTVLMAWAIYDPDDSPPGKFFKSTGISSMFPNYSDEFVLRQMNLQKPKATLCSAASGRKKQGLIASSSGFYYGWFDEFLISTPRNFADEYESSGNNKNENRGMKEHDEEAFSIQDILIDFFSEFKSMYEELCDIIVTIGKEISLLPGVQIKKPEAKQNLHSGHLGSELDDDLSSEALRRQKFEGLAKEIEEWAHHILFEEGFEEDGWVNIECSKLLKQTLNKDGKSKCYLKWFPDSRNSGSATDEDKEDYPCLRCYTTIDAPLEQVCQYLADESRMKDYNDLIVKYRDLEDLSPHSKICWSQCPQILFIKPRDFVTFCHHQWKKDGTQIIVNQAVDHDDVPAILEEGKASVCRAYALRGANYLSRDPNDPNKTRYVLLAHANPGGNLPPWASRAAMSAVVPIIPFKIFHSIEQGVKRAQLKKEMTSPLHSLSDKRDRSFRAGGISQVGYACFWPNGGGLKETEKDIWDD